jgi:hypothetical protein
MSRRQSLAYWASNRVSFDGDGKRPVHADIVFTDEDGRTFEVLAPTRRLAILNLRAAPGNWGAIKSIGLLRSKSPEKMLPRIGDSMPVVREIRDRCRDCGAYLTAPGHDRRACSHERARNEV